MVDKAEFIRQYILWRIQGCIKQFVYSLVTVMIYVSFHAVSDEAVRGDFVLALILVISVGHLLAGALISLRARQGVLGDTLSEALDIAKYILAKESGRYQPPPDGRRAERLVPRLAEWWTEFAVSPVRVTSHSRRQ